MKVDTFDELVKLSDRLYCCWQAALHGDKMMADHQMKVGGEIYEIWSELEKMVENERKHSARVEIEMEKFEQGFAYRGD